MLQRPLVMAALCYIGGIVLRDVLPLPMGLLLLLGLAAFGFWVWNRYYAWRKSPLPFMACWLILGMAMNQWAVQRTDALLAAVQPGLRAEFTGVITEEPVRKGEVMTYILRVSRVQQKNRTQAAKGKVLLNLRQTAKPLAYGDIIRIHGIPELPPEPGNPGQFDYRKYLYNKGIVLVVNGWGDGSVEKLAAGRGSLLMGAALKLKDRLARVPDETLPPEKSALLKGMLFGSQAEIDPEVRQEFVDTGVVHILSVSGYHVGLVLAACCILNSILGLRRSSFTFFSVAVLVFYTALTGAQPAVVRATLMALVLLAGRLLEKDRDWPSGLALSALAILLVSPRTLYNTGFQLSFTATWGILYLSPVMGNRLFSCLPLAWRPALAVPLAAQLSVVPLSAYYFNQVSIISLAANLIIVPLVGVITLLGAFAILGGVVWSLWAEVLNISTGLLLEMVIKINAFLAVLPGAVLYMKKPPVWAAALWFAGLFLVVEGLCRIPLNQFIRRICITRGKAIVSGLLVISLAFILWSLFYRPLEPLTVTFIDVGEGDSVLVRTPRGRVMLIDTGGSAGGRERGFDTGAKILVPVLWNYGISKIDALVLTHPHLDHIGGAPAVLERMDVKRLVLPPTAVAATPPETAPPEIAATLKTAVPAKNDIASEAATMAEITALADKSSIPVIPVSAGDRIMLDPDVSIEVLGPPENKTSGGPVDLNNSSVVLKLSYGQDSLLLTGDIGTEAVDRLMASRRNLRADVLKIPHHGSRNSLSDKFYERVDPDLAVISVGRNLFGHPSKEVLSALEAKDIRITRTDLRGAVTLTSEGHGWRGETVKKGEN